jgi:chemotaxis regulatin CheY-phosphate phosphatase CheZ
MTEPGHLPEAEFQQIEEFISRTPRGREFLREHIRRAQTGVAEEVRVLVSDLRDLWRQQADANNLVNRVQVLRHELQDMSASISQARREIAALRPSEDGNDRFSTASNELDAIIVSTERASSEILTSSERILELIGKLREGDDDTADLYSKIEAEVMEIFTACSFQDLTGQRTTKVINVLRYIEQRIGSMIAIWGEDTP